MVARNGQLWIDSKIRIASDVTGGAGAVQLQRTDYLSSVMTDQIRWSKICSEKLRPETAQPEEILWNGASTFVEETVDEAVLKPFPNSGVSNQLGASTLAVSSDGHLMVVAQNKKSNEAANQLAPSGSGSLDWVDISRSNARDLLKLVRFGGKRELIEECALDGSGGAMVIDCDVMVTGFTRMVHRAGKPEFFCVGTIRATAAEIVARPVTDGFTYGTLIGSLQPIRREKGVAAEISRICKEYLQINYQNSSGSTLPLSFVLEHQLKHLVEACGDPQQAQVISTFVEKVLDSRKSPTNPNRQST